MTITQILYHIITDREYAETVLHSIDLNFISDKYEKQLIKTLQSYRSTYNKLPNEGILNNVIETLVKKSGDNNFNQLSKKIMSYNKKKYYDLSLEHILNDTEQLIKKLALDTTVKDLIVYKQTSDAEEGAIYSYIERITEAYSFTLSKPLGHDYVADFKDRIEYYSKQYENGIYSSIKGLNKVLGPAGFVKKTLNIFLAPPHTGKCVVGKTSMLVRDNIGNTYEIEMKDFYEKF